MFNYSVNFDFDGYEPQNEAAHFIQYTVDKIHNYSPSDAFVKLSMKNSKGVIKATCRVVSQAGEFIAEAADRNVTSVIQKIDKEIMKQIEEWHRCRFDQDLLHDLVRS